MLIAVIFFSMAAWVASRGRQPINLRAPLRSDFATFPLYGAPLGAAAGALLNRLKAGLVVGLAVTFPLMVIMMLAGEILQAFR